MNRHAGSDSPTSVVAWFYEEPKQAFQSLLALQEVERTRGLRTLGVDDAAVVSEASPGRIRVDRTIEFRDGGEGALSGILPQSILSQPAVGADELPVSEHFSELGFHSNLLREIGENMPHDGAALVVLLEEEWFSELRGVIFEEAYVERWALDVD